MRYLYSLIFYIAMPGILLRLWWRSRKAPAYIHRLSERFGYFSFPTDQRSIWVHAVSVGESIAATPLIKQLQQNYPNIPIVVTNMTPTGSAQIKKTFGDSVYNVYVPYDIPGAVNRFLQRTRPHLGIIMETELWPNLIHYANRRNIPVLLANARLSERSARGYRRIKAITKPIVTKLSLVAAQSDDDGKRFLSLGLPKENLMVTGSIKFDIEPPKTLTHEGRSLRHSWDIDRPVWVAASTHPGEEEKVLKAFAQIRAALPNALLILVPRHPERFTEVAELCERYSYNVLRRSKGQPCHADIDIFLGDSMGELFLFYAMCDVAFVGGSLVQTGGHNILEPAALGLPIVSGSALFNFAEISQMLQKAGAMQVVQSENELATVMIDLLQNKTLAKESGRKGLQVIAQNQGALHKHIQWIKATMQSMTPVAPKDGSVATP